MGSSKKQKLRGDFWASQEDGETHGQFIYWGVCPSVSLIADKRVFRPLTQREFRTSLPILAKQR